MDSEPNLKSLILDAKGERSYERMAADCGGNPTAKRLQQMATKPIKAFPDKETIEGISRGTGATPTSVVLASARSLGLRVHSGDDPEALVVSGGRRLRPDQQAAVTALVRSFMQSNEDAGRQAKHHAFFEPHRVAIEQVEAAIADLESGRDASFAELANAVFSFRSRVQSIRSSPVQHLNAADEALISAFEARVATFIERWANLVPDLDPPVRTLEQDEARRTRTREEVARFAERRAAAKDSSLPTAAQHGTVDPSVSTGFQDQSGNESQDPVE